MNRRHFLNLAMLTGTALAGGTANALTLQACGSISGTGACGEALRHKRLLADLRVSLEKRGLTPAQTDALLARAVCPYCGQLLIG